MVSMVGDPFGASKYEIRRQFFKLIGANFRAYAPDGSLAMLTHQRGFRLKEDIRVYADESQTTELLVIQARSILDFSAAYDVLDPRQGVKVGALRRRGLQSMLRDSWEVLDAYDQPIGAMQEDSMALALVRRFATNLVPQSFSLTLGGVEVAEFKQGFNPFAYRMTADFSSDTQGLLDRRLGLAAAFLICAIEGRQEGG